MKKMISIILIVLLLAPLVSCNAPTEPVVISPEEFSALDDTYMVSLNVGMILADPWQDANEIEPQRFMYYYASTALRKEAGIEDGWKDGYLIPETELETEMQKRFNVTVEHLRTNEYYLASEKAYEFGGLGSTTNVVVTIAVLTGNILTLDYDVNGPQDYVIARGTLEIEVSDGDVFSEDFKLLSNQIERTAQYHLTFPSARDEVDDQNVFMMDSGGQSGRGPSRDDVTWYDGENLDSITRFYEDEALPALEAEGHADTSIHEDGWYWSGTYRGGTPLTIDVQPKYGAATYVISVLYDESSDPSTAENMRERDFMQPPNPNVFSEISDYVWPPFRAGVLDTTWSMGDDIEVLALVALYGQSIYLEEEEPAASFPAGRVENYAQRFFDVSAETMEGWTGFNETDNSYTYSPVERTEYIEIMNATTYGREDWNNETGPIQMILTYNVRPSEEVAEVLWSGELEVELSNSGFKYLSNRQVTTLTTTDQAEAERITKALAGSLMIGSSWDRIDGDEYKYDLSLTTFYCMLNPDHPSEIPADVYESFIQKYFDISNIDLKEMADYNKENNTYMVSVDISIERANEQNDKYFIIDQINTLGGDIKVDYHTIWGDMAPEDTMRDSTVLKGSVLLDRENGYRVIQVELLENNSTN